VLEPLAAHGTIHYYGALSEPGTDSHYSIALSAAGANSWRCCMEKKKQEFFRKLLMDRLQALLEDAGATIGDLTDDKERLADDIDLASMESNRDFQLRIRDRERTLIHKIRQALQRLDESEYGVCVVCGEEISERRLLASPVATHCIDCKTEAEQLERRSREF